MNFATTSLSKNEGQALVEYTLIVLLVALVFWVAIKNANLGNALAGGWSKIAACIDEVTSCSSAS